MNAGGEFLEELFLRAPYYSFAAYDLDRVPEVLNDQVFRNAVYLASEEFYRVLERKDFDYAQLNSKEIHTLNKYYNRMCFRPTPFGSFASFSLLNWANGETVRLSGDDEAILHLLPDNSHFYKTGKDVSAPIGEQVLIKNPTLYRLGEDFRYVKSIPGANGAYVFSINAIAAEKFTRALIARFIKQPVRYPEIISWITSRSGSTETEAEDYLNFLIDEQVIFDNRTGRIIGARQVFPGKQIKLIDLRLNSIVVEKDSHLVNDEKTVKYKPYWYAALERKVTSGSPGIEDQTELLKAIQILQRLLSPQLTPAFTEFKAQFQIKFDLQRVPLLQALDPDAGISYGNLASGDKNNMVLDDIDFSSAKTTGASEWTAVHRLLLQLWTESNGRDKYSPLIIPQDAIGKLDLTANARPAPTIAVLYRKAADHLVLEHAGGSTASSLIGRFSVFSNSVTVLCQKLASLEKTTNPGVVFADIGQISDIHSDNINRREQIYPYEIPVNVFSGTPQAQQINFEDLLVSVHNNEVILESRKLRKRVIPRLPTAYNFQRNQLTIFRFLCDLQFQGIQAGLNFDLETYLPGSSFYPRVVYGKVVLSPARWIFQEHEIKSLKNADLPAALDFLGSLRRLHRLPQFVSLGIFDQQLVFDLSNKHESSFFLKCLPESGQQKIQEYLLPDKSIKRGNKALAGQYVALLHYPESIYNGTPQVIHKTIGITRSYLPGSEWLYLKVFCNPDQSNRILESVFLPVIRKHKKSIGQWFFIRFNEDGHHLRVRIKMSTNRIGSILKELNFRLTKYSANHTIQAVKSDTYQRELERYGALMKEVELLFFHGSELAVCSSDTQDGPQTAINEFKIGFYVAYKMISCFMTEQKDICNFAGRVAAALFEEFSGNKKSKVSLEQKYRLIKGDINQVFQENYSSILSLPIQKAMEEFYKTCKHIATASISWGTPERERLITDIVHMQTNRNFKTNQRKQELVIYFCLHKQMVSEMGRSSHSG